MFCSSKKKFKRPEKSMYSKTHEEMTEKERAERYSVIEDFTVTRVFCILFGMTVGILLHLTFFSNGDSLIGGSYEARRMARHEAVVTPTAYPDLPELNMPGVWRGVGTHRAVVLGDVDISELELDSNNPEESLNKHIESIATKALLDKRNTINTYGASYRIACKPDEETDQNTHISKHRELRAWCDEYQLTHIKHSGFGYRFVGNRMHYYYYR